MECFQEIGHTLGHEPSLSKFCGTDFTQTTFSNSNRFFKVRLLNKMVTKKLILVWEFKITLLVIHESKKKQLQ